MESQTRRSGIFVPCSEEDHRKIKIRAVQEGRPLQELATDLLLAGIKASPESGTATPVRRPRSRNRN